MEFLIIVYLIIAVSFGLFVSAMTQQTGAIATSFFIIVSILTLPFVLAYAIVAYILEKRSC